MIKSFMLLLNEKIFEIEGSTRPVALIRIGLVFLIWSRWAGELALFNFSIHSYPKMVLLSIIFYLATVLMCVGWKSQFVTFLTAVALFIMYFFLGFTMKHHTYLLVSATFLLSFTPCGNSYSIDRYFGIQQALKSQQELPKEEGPLWATKLLCLLVTMVYLGSAYVKSNTAFLSGQRLENIFMQFYFGSDYPAMIGFHELMIMLAVSTVFIEYLLAFGLWFRSLHKWLIPAGIIFHLILFYTLPVRTFSLTMCLLYLCFLDPKIVHDFVDQQTGMTTKC